MFSKQIAIKEIIHYIEIKNSKILIIGTLCVLDELKGFTVYRMQIGINFQIY